MSRLLFLFSCFAVSAAAFCFNGCGGAKSNSENPSTSGGGDGSTTQDKAAQDIAKALAELSDEDRKLAEAQKTCPVSGEPLGAMGKPIKLDVKGQPVFICCDGCKKAVTDDPNAILAKLKKE